MQYQVSVKQIYILLLTFYDLPKEIYFFQDFLALVNTYLNFQSLLHIDETVLQDLIPLLQDLLTTNIGLPTKVATSHFISLLITQKQLQVNSKFLGEEHVIFKYKY